MALALGPSHHSIATELRGFAEALPRLPLVGYTGDGGITRMMQAAAQHGYLSCAVQRREHDNRDLLTYGLLNQELARQSAALRELMASHCTVTQAIGRYGSAQQRTRWLAELRDGHLRSAVAARDMGRPAARSRVRARRDGDAYVLDGERRGVVGAQRADCLLVVAHSGRGARTFLVTRDAKGLQIEPERDLMEVDGYLPATIRFESCRLSAAQRLEDRGQALAKFIGRRTRYAAAWGLLGIADACLDLCVRHARERTQFGVALTDHQLVRAMITESVAMVRSAQLLCGWAANEQLPPHGADLSSLVALYWSSCAATRVAEHAVQIHGARGCMADHPAQRYLREACAVQLLHGPRDRLRRAIGVWRRAGRAS